jgi:hypothetical protein
VRVQRVLSKSPRPSPSSRSKHLEDIEVDSYNRPNGFVNNCPIAAFFMALIVVTRRCRYDSCGIATEVSKGTQAGFPFIFIARNHGRWLRNCKKRKWQVTSPSPSFSIAASCHGQPEQPVAVEWEADASTHGFVGIQPSGSTDRKRFDWEVR